MNIQEKIAFVAKIFNQETSIDVAGVLDFGNAASFIRLHGSYISMKNAKKIHDYFQGYGLDQPKITIADNSLCIELTGKLVDVIIEIYYATLQPLINKAQVYVNGKYSETYIQSQLYASRNQHTSIWDITNAIKKAQENLVVTK